MHPACHVLREGFAIELVEALKNALDQRALRVGADGLARADHLHAILPEPGLVDGAVVPIPGEAAELVDDDHVKAPAAAVPDHPLEILPALHVPAGGQGAVGVRVHDLVALPGRELLTDTELPLDADLLLLLTGVTGVDNCFHLLTL